MQSQHRPGRRRAHRAPWLVLVALCASMLLTARASADTGLTADQVADQILAVQDDADVAATKLATLDDQANDLADQLAATQSDVDATSAKYAAMESDLATIAMNKYTGALPQSNMPFSGSIMNDVQTGALSEFALGAGEVDLGELGAVQRDLARQQARLATLKAKNDTARQQLADTQSALDAKVATLTALEDQLRDAEVKRAYEAKLAAKRKQEADAAAAADAKAAALAASAATPSAARGEGATQPTAAAAAPTTATPPSATTTPAGATPTTKPSADAPATTRPATTTPRTTEPPDTEPADAAPADPEPAPVVISSDLACPVAGPRSFGDTWGAARSGGRHHEGTDMISPAGTPLVAMDDGFAKMKTTSLGGNSVGLTGDDGTYYFYAHLSAWEGPSRHVSKGEVIGYVGHTGNTSVNHLHIEIHPGGGGAVNPYSTLRRIC